MDGRRAWYRHRCRIGYRIHSPSQTSRASSVRCGNIHVRACGVPVGAQRGARHPRFSGGGRTAFVGTDAKPREDHLTRLYIKINRGGAEGGRTPDLRIANATLSQLSYGPIYRGSAGGLGPPERAEYVSLQVSCQAPERGALAASPCHASGLRLVCAIVETGGSLA